MPSDGIQNEIIQHLRVATIAGEKVLDEISLAIKSDFSGDIGSLLSRCKLVLEPFINLARAVTKQEEVHPHFQDDRERDSRSETLQHIAAILDQAVETADGVLTVDGIRIALILKAMKPMEGNLLILSGPFEKLLKARNAQQPQDAIGRTLYENGYLMKRDQSRFTTTRRVRGKMVRGWLVGFASGRVPRLKNFIRPTQKVVSTRTSEIANLRAKK